jgi:hypothetical protein
MVGLLSIVMAKVSFYSHIVKLTWIDVQMYTHLPAETENN